MKDKVVFPKICGGEDLIAKEVRYHHSYKSAYILSAARAAKPARATEEATTKDAEAFSQICDYVEQSVIMNKRPELMTSVYERYVDMCMSLSETPRDSVFSLSRSFVNIFSDGIKIQNPVGKKLGNIIYNASIAESAVRDVYDYTSTDERFVTRAALLMRKQLLDVEKTSFLEGPTLDDLKEGDSSPPELVVNFFRVLYGGQNRDNHSEFVRRRAESASQDALFIVQRGKANPAKHVALGMSVKSVTGSKKMVEVLNRFGHCLNYNKLEELETATTEKIQDRQLTCPEGTVVGSPMGLAFDNFDELTQTLSGTDSLHDTMGILYQNIPDAESSHPDVGSAMTDRGKASTSEAPAPKKSSRKRTLDTSNEMPLAPYRKVPKMTSFTYRNTAIYSLPDVSARARHLDLIWMISHAIGDDMLPMWVGFNASLSSSDALPKQEVRYMPNLKQPITSLDVIQETLVTTQKCAEECHQLYGVVTYDLNAAKPAWQMQITEAPRFDNLFIMPGTFHVEMFRA